MGNVAVKEQSYVTKAILPQDRLIMALDVANEEEAKQIVTQLGDSVSFYKLGLEYLLNADYFGLVDWLVGQDKKVFVDLKFHDVPRTVAGAVKGLQKRGATFATVHAGNKDMLEAAVEEKGDVQLLAVTVLTSIDKADIEADLGTEIDINSLVVSRANVAKHAGCDGVVASGLEAPEIRMALGEDFTIVTPGIRPFATDDDQKRIVGVSQAFDNGSDYIVVGRPIRNATEPKAVAEAIQEEIATLFEDQ